jgi:hypothetical protein
MKDNEHDSNNNSNSDPNNFYYKDINQFASLLRMAPPTMHNAKSIQQRSDEYWLRCHFISECRRHPKRQWSGVVVYDPVRTRDSNVFLHTHNVSEFTHALANAPADVRTELSLDKSVLTSGSESEFDFLSSVATTKGDKSNKNNNKNNNKKPGSQFTTHVDAFHRMHSYLQASSTTTTTPETTSTTTTTSPFSAAAQLHLLPSARRTQIVQIYIDELKSHFMFNISGGLPCIGQCVRVCVTDPFSSENPRRHVIDATIEGV